MHPSPSDSRTLAAIRSVIDTSRRLGRAALTYLHSAVQAYFGHQSAPKHLPTN